MPRPGSSTRQRIINSAKELFVRQGITQTTTRQIAEAAGVNEVTVFRHFGTKQGLLLAVFADLGVFEGVGELQIRRAQDQDQQGELVSYVQRCFRALADNPELVRSVVGEAGLYSEEHRGALQRGFLQAQHQLADYLLEILGPHGDRQQLAQAAAVLHVLILGLAVLEVTAGLPEEAEILECSDQDLAAGIEGWLQGCVGYWLGGLPEWEREE